jgi:cysteine-rich repeat protein
VTGTATITTTAPPTPTRTRTPTPRPRCGDGTLQPAEGEQCDDGNPIDCDGCDRDCTTGCGNGITCAPEECDDGNTDPADGCTNACTVCGNMITTTPEQCDDGNLVDSDGCTNACTLCGDGNLVAGEQCDDNNATNGDGCNAACRYELIPGNGRGSAIADTRACVLEFSVVNSNNIPPLDRRGRWNYLQTCKNNDSTCDFDLDSANRTCEFRVVACLNNVDPQLPGCTQRGTSSSLLVRSPSALREPANRANLLAALQNLRDPDPGTTGHVLPVLPPQHGWCTAPFAIRVPLRGTVTRPLRARSVLQTVSLSYETQPTTIRDVDAVILTCTP